MLLQGARSVQTEPNCGTSRVGGMSLKNMRTGLICARRGFHSGVVEHSSLLECNAVITGRVVTDVVKYRTAFIFKVKQLSWNIWIN
jgi:hypothetical protein